MHRFRRTIAGVLAGALAVGVGAVTYASAADQPSDTTAVATVPQAVPAKLARDFGVFRRAAAPSESLAGTIPADSDYVTELGLNPALARRITTPHGFTTKLWIAPTADGTCLFLLPPDAVGPGSSCGEELSGDPYRSAESSTNLDGSIDVVGLAYDGVTAASIAFADGTAEDVPVTDNVYAAHVTKTPRAVQLTDPERGKVTVPVAGYR